MTKNLKLIMAENRFLIVLIAVSILARLVLALLYLDPPDIPHDLHAYLDAGNTILHNLPLYEPVSPESGTPAPYGVVFLLTMASWIRVFGESYALLKIPSILFEVLTIIVLFHLVKNLKNIEIAKYATTFYAFSYISLWSSGAIGNDDEIFIFFMILAIYFLLKDADNLSNLILSGVSLGLAIGTKLIPVIMVPVAMYYLFQNKKYRSIFVYVGAIIVTFGTLILPFYLKEGLKVLFPYVAVGTQDSLMKIDGMSILHLIKMLSYYLIYHAEIPYNTYQFPESATTPFSIIGFIFAILFILKYPLTDKKLELFRNCFIFIFVGIVFSSQFHGIFILWLLPFISIISASTVDTSSDKFSLNFYEITGILLIICSTVIHAILYRWVIDYTTLERSLILFGTFLVPIGTYLTFIKTDYKIRVSWSFVMLVAVAYTKIHTRVLLLFGSLIPSLGIERNAWGYEYFAEIVIMLIAIFFLLFNLHRTTSNDLTFDKS